MFTPTTYLRGPEVPVFNSERDNAARAILCQRLKVLISIRYDGRSVRGQRLRQFELFSGHILH